MSKINRSIGSFILVAIGQLILYILIFHPISIFEEKKETRQETDRALLMEVEPNPNVIQSFQPGKSPDSALVIPTNYYLSREL